MPPRNIARSEATSGGISRPVNRRGIQLASWTARDRIDLTEEQSRCRGHDRCMTASRRGARPTLGSMEIVGEPQAQAVAGPRLCAATLVVEIGRLAGECVRVEIFSAKDQALGQHVIEADAGGPGPA